MKMGRSDGKAVQSCEKRGKVDEGVTERKRQRWGRDCTKHENRNQAGGRLQSTNTKSLSTR